MKPTRLCIVDLGTNSIRFDVYDIQEDGSFERIYRDKQMVRMGEGVFKSKRLSSDAKERVMSAFQDFSQEMKKFEVDKVVGFATSAVRDAEDGREFVKSIMQKFKAHVRILTGDEEARFIAKAIINNENTPDGLYGLIDIGGGSTEISICYKKNILDSYSFDLGAARLAQLFKTGPDFDSKVRIEAVESLRKHVRKEVERVGRKRNWPQLQIMLGSSGTVSSMQKIFEEHAEKTNPMERKLISKMISRMVPLDRDKLAKIPGMESKRLDMIVAGSSLLEEVMIYLDAKYLSFTKLALRDGLFDHEMENLLYWR